MTRIMKYTNSITAIILCIIIVFVSLCSFVCIRDEKDGNTQFFAASFYFATAPRATLSAASHVRIVSWVKRRDMLPDEISVHADGTADISVLSDKPLVPHSIKNLDAYTNHKSTAFNLRI